jgi:tetratricopeptide (TPR) repeat protein
MEKYQPTLFDRHGPAALERIRLVMYSAMVFVLALGTLAVTIGLSVRAIALSLLAATVVGCAVHFLVNAVGSASRVLAIGGEPSTSDEQYSYHQSLVVQGRIDEALAAFEAVIATSPDAIEPRILAAEIYGRTPTGAARAAELLRQAQRCRTITPGRDIYATNRLVDLLLGPLADPSRALVELRRIIEKYPTSAAAKYARQALTRIKTSHALSNELP